MATTTQGSYLVTGATSGIGAAVARALAQHGATLHVIGRDRHRLDDTRRSLMAHGATAVTPHLFDLGELSEIRRLAELPREMPTLDGVVFAAGVIDPIRHIDAAGAERNYLVNHLSKFALIEQWASPWAAAGTRLLVGAPVGRVKSNLDDPMGVHSWSTFHGAKASQYANDVMLHEVNRTHAGLRLTGWNPGSTRGTHVARKLPRWARAAFWLVNITGRPVASVGEQGRALASNDSASSLTWVRAKKIVTSPAEPHWSADAQKLWALNTQLLAAPHG